jgi:fatty acid desaturase
LVVPVLVRLIPIRAPGSDVSSVAKSFSNSCWVETRKSTPETRIRIAAEDPVVHRLRRVNYFLSVRAPRPASSAVGVSLGSFPGQSFPFGIPADLAIISRRLAYPRCREGGGSDGVENGPDDFPDDPNIFCRPFSFMMPESSAPLATPAHDSSVAFLKRTTLSDRDGLPFSEFRKQLTPRYGIVWTHIALGYTALIVTGTTIVLTAAALPEWLRVTSGALLFGLAHAFIQLFFHEAAHYNIAATRTTNDRLANVFVGAMYGLEISAYRVVHFEHHRRLGTTMDTERSYFDPLNMRFFAEALLGVKVLRVLTRRNAIVTSSPSPDRVGHDAQSGARRQRIVAMAIHLALLGAVVLSGQLALALAWMLGTFSVMPLLAALRQLLEHRSESGDPAIDYSQVDHGAVNRLFGDGPFASTFGGAGFNRHLLHHWEPQISYTRLHELEAYLLRTPAASDVRARRSTYWTAFWSLVSW